MKIRLAAISIIAIATACTTSHREVMLIPRPVETVMAEGKCPADATVTETISTDAPESPEGYILSIAADGISIVSRSEAGLFYGRVTLEQLRRQYGRKLPQMTITDFPRFPYRGTHIDVSRHFFSKEVIERQLREMASLKLNTFHLHLTDGTGWRLAVDGYPELTPEEHYTKDDVREVLALSDSLHITVIPEIEMFAHSEEVIAVRPDLGCLVDRDRHEYCIGNDEVFTFLQDVLDEVMELFPSKYIHIGGDEADKSVWAACPKCQARMRHEHLSSPDELQSYGICRMAQYLVDHGRIPVGWDEILDGGLAPSAVVMSWRGEEGGRKAAAMGHDAIMTPGAYCYFDAVQDRPDMEPEAFGGYLPLSKVYSYDPAPEDMEGREHILGVQSNLWTEKIAEPSHLEHMLWPRAFAIAEIGWSPVEGKDYDSFRERALLKVAQMQEDGYTPFDLAKEYGEREGYGKVVEHKAFGCPVTYGTEYFSGYAASGDGALTDGRQGSWAFQNDWQGFLNRDVVVTVDLGKAMDIGSVTAGFGQWYSAMICMPVEVVFEASDDGENFRTLGSEKSPYDLKDPITRCYGFSWTGKEKARYIRVTGRINEDHWGWLFTDEIIVR